MVCVGKKLSKMQSELNAVAASLGADFRSACKSGFTSLLQSSCVQLVWIEEQTLIFRVKTRATSRLSDHPLPCFYPLHLPQSFVGRWACDDTVTHYIYQGRVGDNSREYRGVKERGLHVVSQYWLHAVCFTIANFKTPLVITMNALQQL